MCWVNYKQHKLIIAIPPNICGHFQQDGWRPAVINCWTRISDSFVMFEYINIWIFIMALRHKHIATSNTHIHTTPFSYATNYICFSRDRNRNGKHDAHHVRAWSTCSDTHDKFICYICTGNYAYDYVYTISMWCKPTWIIAVWAAIWDAEGSNCVENCIYFIMNSFS